MVNGELLIDTKDKMDKIDKIDNNPRRDAIYRVSLSNKS